MSPLRSIVVRRALPYALVVLGPLTACASLIGLDEYSIEETASGGAMSTGGDRSTSSGGAAGMGHDSGGAATGGDRAGGGATGGACALPPCPDDEVCRDTASGMDVDAGCDDAAPICDESGTPTCVECTNVSHCADDIECTLDGCADGSCEFTPSDTLCGLGRCAPEVCDSGTGCQSEVVLMNETELYRNGSFEHGTIYGSASGLGPAPWTYVGEAELVYDCSLGGCDGNSGNGLTYAAHGERSLWLAGLDDHDDEASQLLTLPAGARTLRIRAHTSFQTESATPDNDDFVEVWLLNAVGSPLLPSPVWRRTAEDASTEGVAWTEDGIDVDVDVSSLTTTNVRVAFRSSTDDSHITDFFIDHIRITTLVCQ